MKIGILSSRFPPDRCGVGDYSARLAAVLSSRGHGVQVWTMTKRETPNPAHHKFSWPMDKLATDDFVSSVRNSGIETLLVEYTPNRFPMKPFARPLSSVLHSLKAAWTGKIILTVHEAHYPLHFSARGLVHGVPQFLHLLELLRLSDRTIFTYEKPCRHFKRLLPSVAGRMSWLPVGSNVELAAEEREKPKDGKLILLHFGGMHPTHLYDFMFAAFDAVRESRGSDTELVLIGANENETGSRPGVRALGYLDSAEVSRWLRSADLVLAPFLDGVSTRRGSVMAALEHGIPVATTTGASTDSQTPWDEFCLTSPCDSKPQFVNLVQSAVEDEERRKRIGLSGAKYYRDHFDWPVIASQIENL